jgi:uncharacterized membrane protein YhaH (DUF805 family)
MSVSLDRPLYDASWGAAVARFFANYSIFRGRASRREYWWWALTNALILTALNIVASVTGAEDWRSGVISLPLAGGPGGTITTVPGAIALIYGLGTLLPNLAVTWRRLHDTDRSGAWFFLSFVPVIGWIVVFFFLIGRPREEGRRFD